jgi:hypothetical protein
VVKFLEKFAQSRDNSGSQPDKLFRALAWNTQTVPLFFPVRLEIMLADLGFWIMLPQILELQ